MNTNNAIIPQNDLMAMMQQSEDETNTMIAGMLSLVDSNEELNEGLQSQSWCKRMFYTIIGKNKATAAEMRQNHDKLNAYVVQAVTELYNRNKISSQIMVSLSLQITQVYHSHLELKNMVGLLVGKLNEKIESVDNYHTLLQEIDEGVYNNPNATCGLLSVISQIDHRMLSDTKKMRLIERKLSNNDLLNAENTFMLRNFMNDISEIDDEYLGVIYSDLQLYREYIVAELAIRVIESWNLIPASNRKMLKKQIVLDRIIQDIGIDESAELSTYDYYDEVIDRRRNAFEFSRNALIDTIDANDDAVDCSEKEDCDEEQDIIAIAEKYKELFADCEEDTDDDIVNTEDDIAEAISLNVEYYLGSDSGCVTHTGYISYDVREKAKKHIVDRSDVMSGIAGAVLGGMVLGPLGAVGGALLGNSAKNERCNSCDISDIVAIVDASTFNNCKEGLVFTKSGVFFSRVGDVSIFVPYNDICEVYGTSGFLGGKLTVVRYYGDNFTWTDTIIPKNKVADLIDAIKDL